MIFKKNLSGSRIKRRVGKKKKSDVWLGTVERIHSSDFGEVLTVVSTELVFFQEYISLLNSEKGRNAVTSVGLEFLWKGKRNLRTGTFCREGIIRH